ncbi:MAG: cardiolipin synthase ClsB [Quisquiliibacterium sp.]
MKRLLLDARARIESLALRELGGHQLQLLECGAAFFPALTEALAAARQTVFVETYIFEDDPSGRQIASALAQAARRQVRVHLVVDGFGTPALAETIAQPMRVAGVQIAVFRPDRGRRFALDQSRLRRMHRKLAVIDGEVAFIGGINLLDDLNDPNHGALAHRRLDFAVRVRGPVVASMLLAAQRQWRELAPAQMPIADLHQAGARWRELVADLGSGLPGDQAQAGQARAALVLRDNLRFRRAIEREYLRAIGQARREVLIANSYFVPGRRFRRALLAAVARGVRVRLLLQGRVEYRLPHYAAQAMYDELLQGGVQIIEYRRSFLHAKVAVFDDRATVGSSNIDPFSLLLAREANLFVNDQAFAAELRSRLEAAILDGGEELPLVHHRRRPWLVRLVNSLAYVVLRLAVAISGIGARY